MCSIVSGAGFPLKSAIVTLAFPTATPFSNSNCFSSPNALPNHFALFFGSGTARPKCPTVPREKGTFIAQVVVPAGQFRKQLLLLLFEKVEVLGVTFILHLLDRHKAERGGIDAVTHAGRFRAIVKEVPKVRIALVRANFGPFHEEGSVSFLDDICGVDW